MTLPLSHPEVEYFSALESGLDLGVACSQHNRVKMMSMTSKTRSEKAIQLLFGYLIREKPTVKYSETTVLEKSEVGVPVESLSQLSSQRTSSIHWGVIADTQPLVALDDWSPSQHDCNQARPRGELPSRALLNSLPTKQ